MWLWCKHLNNNTLHVHTNNTVHVHTNNTLHVHTNNTVHVHTNNTVHVLAENSLSDILDLDHSIPRCSESTHTNTKRRDWFVMATQSTPVYSQYPRNKELLCSNRCGMLKVTMCTGVSIITQMCFALQLSNSLSTDSPLLRYKQHMCVTSDLHTSFMLTHVLLPPPHHTTHPCSSPNLDEAAMNNYFRKHTHIHTHTPQRNECNGCQETTDAKQYIMGCAFEIGLY